MTHADLDDLAALALDPADGSDALRAHVASCRECSDLLASLEEVRALAGEGPLVPAPAGVRERVLAHARSAAGAGPVAGVTPLPVAARTPRRGVPVWAVGLAAGVALVAGLGLGRLTGGTTGVPEQPEASAVVAAADLTALDSDAPRGTARAVRTDDAITLRVSASELGGEEGVHEVWLINVDGERMIAVGLLAAGDEGEFEVPLGLIEEGYRIVDISVEPDDGDPTHSGVSLARGELA